MQSNLVSSLGQRCANAAVTLAALISTGAAVALLGALGHDLGRRRPDAWSVVWQALSLALFAVVALALLTSVWPRLMVLSS